MSSVYIYIYILSFFCLFPSVLSKGPFFYFASNIVSMPLFFFGGRSWAEHLKWPPQSRCVNTTPSPSRHPELAGWPVQQQQLLYRCFYNIIFIIFEEEEEEEGKKKNNRSVKLYATSSGWETVWNKHERNGSTYSAHKNKERLKLQYTSL